MSERQEEQWLDRELQRVVNGAKPMFDAEQWKRKYPKEYQTLLSRSQQPVQTGRGAGRIVRLVLGRSLGKLAVAAALIAVAGVLLLGRLGPRSPQPVPEPSSFPQPPARMMTMMSLQAAYRQGGTEALNRQCDKALKMLGPRTTSLSLKELLEG